MGRRVLFAEIMIPLVVASSAVHGTRAIDTSWHAPAETQLNNLTSALASNGVYGFIFNSSNTPQHEYGAYNWCNMPHVRPTEYVVADKAYELQYVELIHRHHKRTPYASNAFPVESYQWNCEDAHLFLYGEPLQGKQSSPVFRKGHISPMNPFVPPGWIGSCNFPQITSGGLSDSWHHGADLYAVYHDLLGFLPSRNSDYKSSVRYRVTNNVITSQVAGMVVSGMWWTNDPYPLIVEISFTSHDYPASISVLVTAPSTIVYLVYLLTLLLTKAVVPRPQESTAWNHNTLVIQPIHSSIASNPTKILIGNSI
ncbi:hypothetical protein E5D57_008905 [Metarhizium anisopliae]|nr:hypothetical protein E5D57_008905 [Metarhizium anisopliae]